MYSIMQYGKEIFVTKKKKKEISLEFCLFVWTKGKALFVSHIKNNLNKRFHLPTKWHNIAKMHYLC